jgi:adenylate kinase
MNTQEQQVIIFVGRSGCGKGTQAELLQKNLSGKTLYVGTGAYFRSVIASENLTGRLYKDAYTRGELAPDFLVTGFLANMFMNQYTGVENLIFDGVARLPQEAVALTEMFDFYQIKKIKILYIDVSPEWTLDKLMKRGRADDKDTAIKTKWFHEQVVPVLEYFKKNPQYEFITINGEQSVADVHQEIISKL